MLAYVPELWKLAVKRRKEFDASAVAYDTYRPRYPEALFDDIISTIEAGECSSVLDVGMGTGIGCGPLLARGLSVTGIEPSAAMAEIAKAKFGDELEMFVGRFEDWTADREVDVIVSFNSWHWVDPANAVDLAAEAVRSKGVLALIWTDVVQYGDAPFEKRLSERTGVAPASVFDQVTSCVRYVDADDRFIRRLPSRYRFQRRLDAATYLAVSHTYGRLPSAEVDAVVAEIINDEFGGSVTKIEDAVLFRYVRV